MTPDEKLDTVLRLLDKDTSHLIPAKKLLEQFRVVTKTDISHKDFDILLDKLEIDGHIFQDKLIEHTYRITFQGRQFLSHSFIFKNRPYTGKATKDKINTVWTITKTVAHASNAIIIVIIAAFTAWVSWTSNEQEDKNKQDIITITNRLDKQAATIDSLQRLRTTTKPDTTK